MLAGIHHVPGEGSWERDTLRRVNVCFSNRPFGVKRFQTIHHCSVDVAHGLVLLFGIVLEVRLMPGGAIHKGGTSGQQWMSST